MTDDLTAPAGIVLVMHGGREASTEPTSALQLAVLRMIPLTRAIAAAVRGSGVEVRRPRFRVRGWNGAQASPVADLGLLLDEIRTRYEDVPVALVGHSMGGRAVLRAAGHPSVRAVAGLASWVPAGEPVAQLAGRRVLLVHGSADTLTRPGDTWAYAERARAVCPVTALEVLGGDHPMIRRAGLWHALAAEFVRSSFGLAPSGATTIPVPTCEPGRVTLT